MFKFDIGGFYEMSENSDFLTILIRSEEVCNMNRW